MTRKLDKPYKRLTNLLYRGGNKTELLEDARKQEAFLITI
jgi:hypothetical protein